MMKQYNYKQDILTQTYLIGDLLDGSFVGVVDEMPANKYHGAQMYYSSSDLKFIAKSSPYHFNVMRTIGTGRVKQTDDMIFGSAVHSLLLTPGDFDKEFMILPTMDRRTKVGREAYLLACDQAQGRIVIDVETYDKARECVYQVKQNSAAMEILEPCKYEVSYFWKCPWSGMRFRARVDACTADYLVEVKTSRSASPSAFERQAYNMFYDISMYHYMEGMRGADDRAKAGYFIVIENEAPFVSQVYKVDDLFLELGHDRWMDAVKRLDRGVTEGKWDGYSTEAILPLSAPKWSMTGKNVVADAEGVVDGI